jgi:hypothetical protein
MLPYIEAGEAGGVVLGKLVILRGGIESVAQSRSTVGLEANS